MDRQDLIHYNRRGSYCPLSEHSFAASVAADIYDAAKDYLGCTLEIECYTPPYDPPLKTESARSGELGIEPVFYSRPAVEEEQHNQKLLHRTVIQERIPALTTKIALKEASEHCPVDKRPGADKTTQPLLPIFEIECVELLNTGSIDTVNDSSELHEASPSWKYGR